MSTQTETKVDDVSRTTIHIALNAQDYADVVLCAAADHDRPIAAWARIVVKESANRKAAVIRKARGETGKDLHP
jgi:hypothetical protein